MHDLARRTSFLPRLGLGLFAFAFAVSLLTGGSANAGTVLAFGQLNPSDTITATESGGVTTLSTAGNADGGGVSIPVLASSYLGVPQPLGLLMYETFVNVTSTGAATSSGGTVSQAYSGTIEFTSAPGGAGTLFLSVTFSGGNQAFTGSAGGASASLNASEPGDSVMFTIPGQLASNAGMSLSFSGLTPGLGITGGSVAGFGAQNSGTFSATVVPEPGTLALASIAVVFGSFGFRRARRASSK